MEKITGVTTELVTLGSGQTVRVTVTTERGLSGSAELPSGISVGAGEAVVVKPEVAKRSIDDLVAKTVIGLDCLEQREVDVRLMALDDTPNRAQLGVNALLPVSLAVARAGAAALDRELYTHIADLAGTSPRLPECIQVMIEGGKHALKSAVSLQELSILGSPADGELVLHQLETFAQARQVGIEPGGEGGLILGVTGNQDAIQLLAEAVAVVNPRLKLALDVAASHSALTPDELSWLLAAAPVALVEDPVSEDDVAGWQAFTAAHGADFLVAADDLTIGNPARIKDAVKTNVANCLVVKLNQTATLSEIFDLVALARVGNWQIVASHRGRETSDTLLADLAVGLGAEYLKAGTTRSPERKAKYDRLAQIAAALPNLD